MVELLGAWWSACGKPGDAALVFPNETDGGYLSASAFTKYALSGNETSNDRARRKGPTKLRTFHSVRHAYARLCLENGLELTWLSRQLGPANTTITERTYGHWSRTASKTQVAKLAGLFPRPVPQ